MRGIQTLADENLIEVPSFSSPLAIMRHDAFGDATQRDGLHFKHVHLVTMV